MTYETAISALDAARTGDELLRVLDALNGDLPRADHVLNEGFLRTAGLSNVATLEPMEF